MPELEPEEALEAEWEITDLDPHQKSSSTPHRWVDGQRFSFRTRLWMALFTILGLALFCWLLLSPLHVPGASQLELASPGHISTPSHPAPSRRVQMVVVQNVIYLLDQDGRVSALWTRHKYVYVLWQQSVASSSQLLRVDRHVVYLAAPDGRIVALRTSDGAGIRCCSNNNLSGYRCNFPLAACGGKDKGREKERFPGSPRASLPRRPPTT